MVSVRRRASPQAISPVGNSRRSSEGAAFRIEDLPSVRVDVRHGRRNTLLAALILSLKHLAAGTYGAGSDALAAAEHLNERVGLQWEYAGGVLLAAATHLVTLFWTAGARLSIMTDEEALRELFE